MWNQQKLTKPRFQETEKRGKQKCKENSTLVSMYMNTYSNNQESVDAEEQNCMYEDRNPTGVHVPEFDEARPSWQLEEQPRR